MKKQTPEKISNYTSKLRAGILLLIIAILCAASLLTLLFAKPDKDTALVAKIYQQGTLLQTIDLTTVTTPYTLVITTKDGGSNTIRIRPDAIGICEADCPDRLCVKMGEITSSRLPIVCLPHSLVIQLEEKGSSEPDGITY